MPIKRPFTFEMDRYGKGFRACVSSCCSSMITSSFPYFPFLFHLLTPSFAEETGGRKTVVRVKESNGYLAYTRFVRGLYVEEKEKHGGTGLWL